MLKLIISGSHKGHNYADVVTFKLIPPNSKDYAGNGHKMIVDMAGNPAAIHYVDCRYSGTTDLWKLADIWIKDYYGNTVKEVRVA